MKIIGFTDIHGDVSPIERMRDEIRITDLVLIAGDITHFGGKREAAKVIGAVSRHAKNILAVPGNCDTEDVADFLYEKGLSLHASTKKCGDFTFAGLGGSLPCPGPTPGEHSEDELSSFLEQAALGIHEKEPFLLVSHQPPFDTQCDIIRSGCHVGSRSVRAFIEKYRPAFCLTGHIHESSCRDECAGTILINPGPLNAGAYAFIDTEENIVEIRHLKT